MLKMINTKLLIAILAALTVFAGLLVRQHEVSERNAAAAAKTAAILAQQQHDAEVQKKHNQDFMDSVTAQKKKSNSMPARESKGWQTYVP